MDDFLYALKIMLLDRLPQAEVDRQIGIYEDYINEEIAGGKTLETVLRKLGDPAKVADLIVEDYEQRIAKEKADRENAAGGMTAEEINAKVQNPKHGVQAEFQENEGWDVHIGKLKLNTWYGRLIILGIVLILFIVFSELTR